MTSAPFRLIPSLLLNTGELVKTRRFSSPVYIGDPINTVRIFNEKQVDELLVLDISKNVNSGIDYTLLDNLASECFMPLAYGGHIQTLSDAQRIFNLGFEKFVSNVQFIVILIF